MRNFEKEHRQRVDNIIQNSVEQHRYSAVPFTNTQEASERIARNSVSASTALVDINNYKYWRRLLNKWKFPLFQLPTEENIFKAQDKYISKRLKEKEENGEFNHFKPQQPKGTKVNFTMNENQIVQLVMTIVSWVSHPKFMISILLTNLSQDQVLVLFPP